MTAPPGLPKVIGVGTLTLSVINCIVGSAIFVVPATVAADLGSAAVLGYLVAGAAVLLVALCFAEAGSRVAGEGGAYAFVERAFGPWAGFVAANLGWFPNGVLASAAVANALVATAATVVPGIGGGIGRALVLIGIYGGFAAINVRGTAMGARAAAGLTVAKLIPLFLLVLAGAFAVRPANLAIGAMPPIGSLGRSALLLIFALTGLEIAIVSSGEVRDPTRTIPRAAVLGVALTVVLYVAIHQVAQGILGDGLARSGPLPLAAAAEGVMGPFGRSLLIAGAVVSMVGFFASDVLANPRSIFVLAERGLLPRILARVHPRFHTPHVSVVFYAAVACAFAIAGSFERLALLNALGVLLIYLGVILADLRLRFENVRTDRPPLVLPGGPLVPVLAIGFVGWLIGTAQPAEMVAIVLFLAVTSAAYWGIRRRPKSPIGA